MRENNEMRGAMMLQVIDREGRVVRQVQKANRIVTSGRQLVAQRFAGQVGGVPPTEVTHIGVGTNATAPTDDDTALTAERPPRKPISQVDYSEITESGVKRVRVRLTAIFDFGDANGTDPLQEAGIFTAQTGGRLYNRVVFEPVTKSNAFQLTLIWDIVF